MKGALDWFVLACIAVLLFIAWPWLKDGDDDDGRSV